MLEELATAAYAVGRLEDAFPAIERAIAIYGELGDEEAVGRCTRVAVALPLVRGRRRRRAAKALEAIAILEPLGESVELARAYSGLSQLAMLAEDAEQALEWGERALELATRLGDEQHARARARQHRQRAGSSSTTDETATLLEAHAVADAAGDRHEAARALDNLGYSAACAGCGRSRRCGTRSRRSPTPRSTRCTPSRRTSRTTIAWLRLRAGEWDEAERVARREIESGSTVAQLLAKTVLTELAVRRGDPDAAERLADLAAQADRAGELQRIVPVLELATEWALTSGAPMPTERLEQLVAEMPPARQPAGWRDARRGLGRRRRDRRRARRSRRRRRTPRCCGATGAAAADAFGEVGWTYDRALMLSLLDDEESLAEAIEIARGLGAEPLTRRVAGRMRELGLRVPHGPAGGDAREPGRADRAPARGARAARRRASRTRRSPSGSSSRRGPPSTTSPPC